eukprot:363217-Chlamydomonas_euryale.AAC.5
MAVCNHVVVVHTGRVHIAMRWLRCRRRAGGALIVMRWLRCRRRAGGALIAMRWLRCRRCRRRAGGALIAMRWLHCRRPRWRAGGALAAMRWLHCRHGRWRAGRALVAGAGLCSRRSSQRLASEEAASGGCGSRGGCTASGDRLMGFCGGGCIALCVRLAGFRVRHHCRRHHTHIVVGLAVGSCVRSDNRALASYLVCGRRAAGSKQAKASHPLRRQRHVRIIRERDSPSRLRRLCTMHAHFCVGDAVVPAGMHAISWAGCISHAAAHSSNSAPDAASCAPAAAASGALALGRCRAADAPPEARLEQRVGGQRGACGCRGRCGCGCLPRAFHAPPMRLACAATHGLQDVAHARRQQATAHAAAVPTAAAVPAAAVATLPAAAGVAAAAAVTATAMAAAFAAAAVHKERVAHGRCG